MLQLLRLMRGKIGPWSHACLPAVPVSGSAKLSLRTSGRQIQMDGWLVLAVSDSRDLMAKFYVLLP